MGAGVVFYWAKPFASNGSQSNARLDKTFTIVA